MTDISKCSGYRPPSQQQGDLVGCPLRDKCWRYRAPYDMLYQSWIETSFNDDRECSMFWDAIGREEELCRFDEATELYWRPPWQRILVAFCDEYGQAMSKFHVVSEVGFEVPEDAIRWPARFRIVCGTKSKHDMMAKFHHPVPLEKICKRCLKKINR